MFPLRYIILQYVDQDLYELQVCSLRSVKIWMDELHVDSKHAKNLKKKKTGVFYGGFLLQTKFSSRLTTLKNCERPSIQRNSQ